MGGMLVMNNMELATEVYRNVQYVPINAYNPPSGSLE